jgi:hypothetical protein
MANFTVTITPTGANTIGAKWCIVGVTDWLASAVNTTLAIAGQTISFKYVEGYATPANITITAAMITALGTTGVYTGTQWLAAWGPPMCGCLFRGQALFGGSYHTTEASFPSDSRIVRWGEIGAFRFLGATANTLKNEAGFLYTSEMSDECVMSILPLKSTVVVYSNMEVILMNPVSQPVPAWGVDKILSNIGIMNPLAAASDGRNRQLFVDKEGTLREISMGQYGQGYEVKSLGYNHIFSTMQASFNMSTGVGVIAITYNPDEDEFYISNGVDSYVYSSSGALTEIGVAITSYVNVKTSLIANEIFASASTKTLGGVTSLITDGYTYLETEIIDFGLSAIKTIKQVEIGGSLGTSAVAYVMIKWRNDRSSTFSDTSWVRCSPNGVATPIVSGSDFKICIKMTPVSGVVLNNITVEWQLSDKSSVRGNYVSGSAS